jgi:hypothetical protein
MSNYYKLRINALRDIDNLLSNNTPIEIIIYKICTKYGLSKKIVYERIQQIEDIQKVKQKEQIEVEDNVTEIQE